MSLVLASVMGLSPLFWSVQEVQAAALSGGSLTLSDSQPSATTVSYTLDFDNVTTGTTIKCIQVKFNAAADMSGSVPTGMTTTSAAFGGTSDFIPTPGSWSVDATTNGTVKITYATGEQPASASDRTVILTTITSGSTVDTTYYAQLRTFTDTGCSTPSGGTDTGTVTFVYVSGQAVSLTVDPSLTFALALVASSQTVNAATTNVATTTTTIPLGTVTASTNGIGAHDVTITTNASGGYTVYIRYTGKPTYLTADIDDHTGTNASPTTMSAGTEAFGYTTNDSTLGTGTVDRFTSAGGNKWAAFTTSNLEVAYSAAAVSNQTTRVGYQVGVSGTTQAGTYEATTVVLTATPTY